MARITNYEKQYIKSLREISKYGYADGVNERTGIVTKRLPGMVLRVDLGKEFPILKSKFVAAKTALNEILWIWQKQSNNINDLNAKIWDSWADDNGSIGKAYGYQMNQPVNLYLDVPKKSDEAFRSYKNQAEFVIEYFREQPNGRWAVTTLWSPSELAGMEFLPCCHTTTCNLDGGKLNLVLDQRSGDMPYGVAFNTTQYAELAALIANDLGVPLGIMTHVIADAHIYANQFDGVDLQLRYYDVLEALEREDEEDANMYAHELHKAIPEYPDTDTHHDSVMQRAIDCIDCTPKFYYGDEKNVSFFKVDSNICHMEDYKNMGKITFGEVAV